MPSDLASASARVFPFRVLLRDQMVQLAAWVVAAEVVVYAFPVLDSAALATFGASRFEIPLMALATAAALYNLSRISDDNERRFWQGLGLGSLCALVTLTLATAFSRTGADPTRHALVAAGYVCFSVAFLLSAERMPHMPRMSDYGSTARRLRWSGVVLVSLCWFVYFVAMPMVFDPASTETLPDTLSLVVVLDVLVVARFAGLAAGCRSPRWTMLYTAIAVAMATVLVTDVLDLLVANRVVFLTTGSGANALWGLPPVCLLVAYRLRHVPRRAADPAASERNVARDREPTTAAFLMMALAACFPLAHFALREIGGMTPTIEAARNVAALASMTVVGGMAVVAYRRLERQRIASARGRTALDERLREAKKMEALGRLSSVVTHEFLNLLNAIGGYIDLTLDSLNPDDAHADNLRRAHDVVRRTTVFAKRLLILSRGQPFRSASVGLNQTLRDLMPEIQGFVKPPAVVLATIGTDDDHVAISADYLREVLVALATNAAEAMEHGGRLTIEAGWLDLEAAEALARAVRPGRYARVVVGDTGVGMPGDVLAHLFEPFFTTKPKPRARGLGLATAYVVTTQHGGSIDVTSELGVGTTAVFLLPAVAAPLE